MDKKLKSAKAMVDKLDVFISKLDSEINTLEMCSKDEKTLENSLNLLKKTLANSKKARALDFKDILLSEEYDRDFIKYLERFLNREN